MQETTTFTKLNNSQAVVTTSSISVSSLNHEQKLPISNKNIPNDTKDNTANKNHTGQKVARQLHSTEPSNFRAQNKRVITLHTRQKPYDI